MEYVKIHPIKNEEIDTFVEDCNLFAVFDAPVNVLFSKNLLLILKNIKIFLATIKWTIISFFRANLTKV